jgi:hypothetical protein
MTEIARKPIFGKPVDGKPANDDYRCELCGAWIEYRDLSKALAHEGPLPHRSKDGSDKTAAGRDLSCCPEMTGLRITSPRVALTGGNNEREGGTFPA